MSRNKEFKSNTKEIIVKYEDVSAQWKNLSKIIQDSAVVLDTYSKKTNIPIFSEIGTILKAHDGESIRSIRKVLQQAMDATLDAHKKMSDVANSGLKL